MNNMGVALILIGVVFLAIGNFIERFERSQPGPGFAILPQLLGFVAIGSGILFAVVKALHTALTT